MEGKHEKGGEREEENEYREGNRRVEKRSRKSDE